VSKPPSVRARPCRVCPWRQCSFADGRRVVKLTGWGLAGRSGVERRNGGRKRSTRLFANFCVIRQDRLRLRALGLQYAVLSPDPPNHARRVDFGPLASVTRCQTTKSGRSVCPSWSILMHDLPGSGSAAGSPMDQLAGIHRLGSKRGRVGFPVLIHVSASMNYSILNPKWTCKRFR
jgi:hypothetical protein